MVYSVGHVDFTGPSIYFVTVHWSAFHMLLLA